ncbi:M56 family metallopeptidase [Candidatus Palauibacter sp.]|uniref:M56 family metallopeptidase n=1 Tax=Candidatus Palauibacter sp. TaxID=3101350 RepID=UPI003AF31381
MTDLILQIGASKLVLSVGLAGVAWIVQRRLGWPSLAHGLWLLPLAALLVPPLVSIPIWPGEADPVAPVAAVGLSGAEPTTLAGVILVDWLKSHGKEGLVWLWLLGTASVLGWTLLHTLRFHRSLLRASAAAPPDVQRIAREIAGRLGLGAAPTVYITRAQVSPMVWWAGGEARVLLPSPLLADMDGSELRCILAHELAHVRRRDHVVRWLEWLACAAFWWNPVAWWARRRLRASEELCCDALAVASIRAEPRAYAGALLRVIDFMSTAGTPGPLTFASTIDRCGRASRLERRFGVIMTNRTPTHTPRWLRVALRCGAVCLLAGGLIYCTDQSDLTSVDPAFAPANVDTRFGDLDLAPSGFYPRLDQEEAVARLDGRGDDPAAARSLQVVRTLGDRIEALATEHALPVHLAEALRAAGDRVLSVSRRLSEDEVDEPVRTPALFLAVTPDDGTGDSKTVMLDLAGLRSTLSEGPVSPEALHAELARHLRVAQNSNPLFQSLLQGTHLECAGAEGSMLSSDERTPATMTMTMTCETAETSTGRLRVKGRRPKD